MSRFKLSQSWNFQHNPSCLLFQKNFQAHGIHNLNMKSATRSIKRILASNKENFKRKSLLARTTLRSSLFNCILWNPESFWAAVSLIPAKTPAVIACTTPLTCHTNHKSKNSQINTTQCFMNQQDMIVDSWPITPPWSAADGAAAQPSSHSRPSSPKFPSSHGTNKHPLTSCKVNM